jgi:nucleotidyltransferase substrate binding protein (TIGR01987 family)
MAEDIRWEQRFINLKKAFTQLKSAAEKKDYSELERQGLIKAFEFTFELSWKTLQDFLENKGFKEITGPKPVIQQAFKDGYIADGEGWMNMLLSRNLASHTYEETTAKKIADDIKSKYYKLLEELIQRLEKKVK